MKLNSEQPIKTGVLIEDRGQVFYLKDPRVQLSNYPISHI